jgi:hypothetical protein
VNDGGVWWIGVINENRENDFTYGVDCTREIFWAEPTAGSGIESAITPEMLAGYAYDEIGVPEEVRRDWEMATADVEYLDLHRPFFHSHR